MLFQPVPRRLEIGIVPVHEIGVLNTVVLEHRNAIDGGFLSDGARFGFHSRSLLSLHLNAISMRGAIVAIIGFSNIAPPVVGPNRSLPQRVSPGHPPPFPQCPSWVHER